MIHIRVPATSANMGPGFDSIGVALQLYNHLWVEEIPEGVEIEIRKEQPIAIPTDESNLIYQTMRKLYDAKGLKMPGVRLIQSDDIPMVPLVSSAGSWQQMNWLADLAPRKNWQKWQPRWKVTGITPTLLFSAAWW